MRKYSTIKSSIRKTKKRMHATHKAIPSCVGRSMSASGSMSASRSRSIYGIMYNQEEEDVDRAINSLAKYIK